MLIQVTQKHIDEGKRRVCGECPVALAVSEVAKTVLPGVKVTVSSLRVWFEYKGLNRSVRVPKTVEEFINAFDENKPVEPFEFELPFPTLEWA